MSSIKPFLLESPRLLRAWRLPISTPSLARSGCDTNGQRWFPQTSLAIGRVKKELLNICRALSGFKLVHSIHSIREKERWAILSQWYSISGIGTTLLHYKRASTLSHQEIVCCEFGLNVLKDERRFRQCLTNTFLSSPDMLEFPRHHPR